MENTTLSTNLRQKNQSSIITSLGKAEISEELKFKEEEEESVLSNLKIKPKDNQSAITFSDLEKFIDEELPNKIDEDDLRQDDDNYVINQELIVIEFSKQEKKLEDLIDDCLDELNLDEKQMEELIRKNKILTQKKQNNHEEEKKNENQIVNLKVKDNALNERNDLKRLFCRLESKLNRLSTYKERQKCFNKLLPDNRREDVINKLLLINQKYPDSSVFNHLANVLCLHPHPDFVFELDDSKLTKKIWTDVLVLCKMNPDLLKDMNFYRLMLFLDTGLAENGLRTYNLDLPLSLKDKDLFEQSLNKNFGEFLIAKSISNMIASNADFKKRGFIETAHKVMIASTEDFEQRGFIVTAHKVLKRYEDNITEEHKEMFCKEFGQTIESFIDLPIEDIDSFVANCKKDNVALNASNSVQNLPGSNVLDLSFAVKGDGEEGRLLPEEGFGRSDEKQDVEGSIGFNSSLTVKNDGEEGRLLHEEGFGRSDETESQKSKQANSSPKSQKKLSCIQQ